MAKPQADRIRDRSIVSVMPARARPAIDTQAQQGWRATWDRDTGVPAWLWGGHVVVAGVMSDAAIAERAARDFLAQHGALLAPGARDSDFVLVANRVDDGIRTIGFMQTWRGVPVIGGKIAFVFARDRLFAISSSAWPRVTTSQQRSAILPLVRDGVITYHAVDVVDDGHWRVYRDARGREIARESRIMDATATLKYSAPVRHPGGARDDFAAPLANITVNSVATTTATNGLFTWPGTAAATVAPSVTGTYVRVINQAGAAATASLTAPPGGTATWDLATDELGDAQLATYIYGSIAKARARIVNPSASAWLDTRLDFFVNENGSCNAYSTGNDVHFFRKNAMCENTGRLADVVFHEFGHSLHNNSLIAGMGAFESHLSEGLADFFAANLTEDPAVGRGFYLDEQPLRDIDPLGSDRMYPLDLDFDPHISGLIIAGALWDLRKALVKQLGTAAGIARTERIFTGVMQRADDIGTTFVAALIADDDDGNLGNNTPNYCALERAFGSHGLVPDHVTTRVSPPSVDGLELTMTVDTPAGTTCTPPAIAAITVTWRIGDGVPSTFDLVPDGDAWRGAFPLQPDGTIVLYSVDVTYDDGRVQMFPNNPADPRYQLFIGNAVPIYCESFNTDPAWPQTSNMGPEWQWGPPAIGLAGGDPAVAFTGTNVLGTDLSADGAYRPDLVISTTMPAVTSRTYELFHLQYWRWLTVEDATFDQATIRANNIEIWRNAKAISGTLDHVDREWRFHDIDITPYVVDGTVELQWTLSSDFGKELGGWTLDDVCIVGLQKIPTCGDGEVDTKEQCDDGNTTDDDGCNHACIDEITAGGGGCCDAGGTAPSNVLLAGVLLLLRRRRVR
jgi:cysteine-rich repeat protein